MKNKKIFEDDKFILYSKLSCKKCYGTGTNGYIGGKGRPCKCLAGLPKVKAEESDAK